MTDSITIELPIQWRPWCHYHDGEPELCEFLVGHPLKCDLRPRPALAEDFADRLTDELREMLRRYVEIRQIAGDTIRRMEGREPSPISWIPESLTATETVERMLLCPDGKWLA